MAKYVDWCLLEKEKIILNPEIKIPRSINTYFPTRFSEEFHIWICVVPCLPIHIWWELKC